MRRRSVLRATKLIKGVAPGRTECCFGTGAAVGRREHAVPTHPRLQLQVLWVVGLVELPACLLGTEPRAWDLSQPGRRGLPPGAAVRRKM